MDKIVYFLDIDDCLIKTTGLTQVHLDTLQSALAQRKIDKAKVITYEFAQTFRRIYAVHQNRKISRKDNSLIDMYLNNLSRVEKQIVSKYGEIKIWSREACLYITAETLGIKLTNSDLTYITTALWNSITQSASFFPDALPFLKSLQMKHFPFYLITASDCRLILDDKSGLFIYNPDYSRKLKLARLTFLTKLGILPENIFIADPYDKPNPRVFRQALAKAKKDSGDKINSVMIGDSVKNDLLPAQKAGIKTLVWINREATKEKGGRNDGIITVNKLTPDLA